MDNWFNSKWFVRAISLGFAILLFVVVYMEDTKYQTESKIPSGSDKVHTFDDVPVDVLIDSEKFVVSGVPDVVSLSLEGSTRNLTPVITLRNFEVYVDLRDLGEGTHTVELEYDKIPNELSVYIEPKTIEIDIEERATGEFPVEVDFINLDQLPAGYELGRPEVKPGTVKIASSRSVIDQIAIVKVYIDVAGLTESVDNRELPVNVYDNQGNALTVRVDPTNVVVSVDVDNPSKVVPLEVSTKGELPDDYELVSITPDVNELEVFATTSTLEEIENITTEEIDLSEIKESGTVEVDIDLPEGAQVESRKIKVEIEVEQTKVIEDVSIDITNDDGQDVIFKDPDQSVMSVTLVGSDELIKEVSVDDIELSIDVKDLGIGEHKVPVAIIGPEDLTLSAEFEEVMIEII